MKSISAPPQQSDKAQFFFNVSKSKGLKFIIEGNYSVLADRIF